MNINVLLLCFNERALLPHVVKHYKKYLPSCTITILDNQSTDDSVKIAKDLGCGVTSWDSNNINDESLKISLRNEIWKKINDGWIIMADMDEFVCVTEDDLRKEMNLGVSILTIKGYDMIGESETVDLSDIDLQEIKKCIENDNETKNLCFLREAITDMNYGPGSHYCHPTGNVVYSSTAYMNKHMSTLGLNFLTNKYTERHARSEQNRKMGWSVHYTQDLDEIKKRYMDQLNECKLMSSSP